MRPLCAILLLLSAALARESYVLAEVELRRVFPGSRFARPLYLTHAGDGSGRVFVVEQPGTIRVLGEGLDQVFLDLRAKVNDGPNEAGLLGLAFHPHYAENGRFYVYYTYGNLFSRFSEFRVSADPDQADPASERVLFEVKQPAGNHNGGQLAFGPDGYLYIGLGDGGGAGDQYGNGQNLEDLLGDILRIDVDRTQGELAYAIPPDNPFAGNTEGWREEIWAWGLRNPWRFSFDRLTGALWAGDVGQNKWEEVDLIEKGGNYGWNIMEGSHCFSPSTNCDTTGLKLPVVEYSHSEGKSISGGYVYRGARLIRLVGVYVYGDYVSQQIWGLRYEGGQVVEHQPLAQSPSPIASFGEDEEGEVYVVGLDGMIYVLGEEATLVSAEENAVPGAFVLQQNYPNPFNGSTLIRFSLATPAQVRLEVFDLLGRRVALLEEGRREAGQYQVFFDATGLGDGVYLCRLQAGTWTQTRKLVLVK
ncbi:MAG: PQQ-dependent sugar dehydrogenase [Candidatus Latescibacteria bacterium]|nr:PQQ-dependent sugar dehydrogenase [Candidatus Latescibacterota bacterium]